jgi:hypothetical protein
MQSGCNVRGRLLYWRCLLDAQALDRIHQLVAFAASGHTHERGTANHFRVVCTKPVSIVLVQRDRLREGLKRAFDAVYSANLRHIS